MDLISKVLAASTNDVKININTDTKSLSDLTTLLVNWIGVAAGLVAFFYLVYSGFLYLTAAGNPDQAKKGGQGIINAVIGIVVIVLAWWLVTALKGGIQG